MPSQPNAFPKLRSAPLGFLRLYKAFHHRLQFDNQNGPSILLILGCQRSGTSLMYRILERDLNTWVYRESSGLSSQDPENLRLNDLESVRSTLRTNPARIVVLKPLVESHRAGELLEQLEGARAVWMYRHYKDVARSNLEAFGIQNGIEDLRPIVEGDRSNWRSEGVSGHARSMVARHFAEDMNPYDAAALFWYTRNHVFLEQDLGASPRVLLCRYDDLVRGPSRVMQIVYKLIRHPYPGQKIVREVHGRSLGRGAEIELSPQVETVCEQLYVELNQLAPEIIDVGQPVAVAPSTTQLT